MLTGSEIRTEIESGRIVIDPPLTIISNGVSVDVALAPTFLVPNLPSLRDVDITVGIDADPYEFSEEVHADEYILEPQGFVLGETAERLALPTDICGWIEGKSGRARLGLQVHVTAPKIDPGWGLAAPKSITLEIVNHSAYKLRLRAGAPIAQLVFHRLAAPVDAYSGGHATKGSASSSGSS
jgi:dCTP deaminase